MEKWDKEWIHRRDSKSGYVKNWFLNIHDDVDKFIEIFRLKDRRKQRGRSFGWISVGNSNAVGGDNNAPQVEGSESEKAQLAHKNARKAVKLCNQQCFEFLVMSRVKGMNILTNSIKVGT